MKTANSRVTWTKDAWALVADGAFSAMQEAAEIVAAAARKEAPEGRYARGTWGTTDKQKGALKKSIRVEKTYYPKTGQATYTVKAGGQGSWGDAYYARFVEFGTKKMEPRYFMKKGLKKSKRRALKTIQQAMSRHLRAA